MNQLSEKSTPVDRPTRPWASHTRRDFITSPKPSREWLQCWGRIDAAWRKERLTNSFV